MPTQNPDVGFIVLAGQNVGPQCGSEVIGLDGIRPEIVATSVSISTKPNANREKLVTGNEALARHQWPDTGTTGRGGNTPLSSGAVVGGRETVRAPRWILMKRGHREQTGRRQKLLHEE